jgi:hypothetical protein
MRRVKRRDSKRVPSTVQSAQSHGRAHERGPVPDPVEGAVRRTWRVAIWRPTHLMSVLQGPTAQISQLNTLLSPYSLLPGPFSWLGLPLSPLFTDARRAGRYCSTAHERHDTRTRHTHMDMDMDMVCIITTCPSDEGRADGHLAAGWARGRPRPHQAHRSSGAAAVARRRAARARTASAATAASTAAAT